MANESPSALEGAKSPRPDSGQTSPPARRAPDATSRLVAVVSAVAIVAVLSLAREVLIPLTLAILLSFVLAPLVRRLVKLGLGRILAVLCVSTLSLLVVAGLAWLMASQSLELAENLPQYRDNIRQKLNSAQSNMYGTLGRASDSLKQISAEMSKADNRPPPDLEQVGQRGGPAPATAPATEPQTNPMPVEIVEKPMTVFQAIIASFTPLLNPLATAGIVIVFVVLILLYREDLRDRVIYLIGTGRLTTTTQAMDEGASRVSRYLLMLLMVNSSYGLAVGIGLSIIGVPNAALFGVLAALVRFVPYVGPWVGAVLPIALSLAVFDSWTRPFITIGLFVLLELVLANIIEPWLYGSRTGISAVAVMVAAVFWGWLWGPVGLIMATPLTVCLVVMGRYIPGLEFLYVLLGDGPSLPPQAKVYQRLLATEYDDVFQFTQEYLKDRPLIDLYQEVLMPALAMAEHDRQAGRLEDGKDQFIYMSLRDLIEELGDRHRSAASAQAKAEAKAEAKADAKSDTAAQAAIVAGAPVRPPGNSESGEAGIPAVDASTPPAPAAAVLCIPARDEADEISALMLVQLLEFQGLPAKVVSVAALADEMTKRIDALTSRSICVCAMPPAATSHARYVCKGILSRFADTQVIVGIWNASDLDRARERLHTSGTQRVTATFGDALALLRG